MNVVWMAPLLALTAGADRSPAPEPAAAETTLRQMVVTIDDLPAQRAPSLSTERLEGMTTDLLQALEKHQVPAIGFVNEEKLYSNGELMEARTALLEQWLDSGIELGNHTFSHPDLHRTPLDDFRRDVLRGETVTRPLAGDRDIPWRFFRHPFLHTGLDLETKVALEEFLAEHEYRVAPVTIDNSEWIFARAFDNALEHGDGVLLDRLGRAYLDYMAAMVAYYEEQAQALFGRPIPQILLIHANDLNGQYLGALLTDLARRGYRFIDLDTALQDPAYRSADTYVGPGGITWLHRWALTRGLKGDFIAGEPTTPQWIQELAGYQE